jgi:hypothetical protein
LTRCGCRRQLVDYEEEAEDAGAAAGAGGGDAAVAAPKKGYVGIHACVP